MKRTITPFIAAIFLAALAGCATRPTVDDDRELNSQLMFEMKAYGAAAAALRTAIVRSAALNDSDCSIQYELPFEAMTSYGVSDADSKIAWLRALGVNEGLEVIAADPTSGLEPGDFVARVTGYEGGNTLKMVRALLEARDSGEPFELQLVSGKRVTISPFRTCRGHTLVASPLAPAVQQYHWTQSVHPLEVFHRALTSDEAQWVVLWTQGLSELGGAQMKTYAFMMGSMKWIAVLALGATGAAIGTSSAGQVAAVQIAGGAASLTTQAAANRASLTGINGIAADVFDRADQWAFENMRKLGMNPRAGLSLHEKLVAQGAASNAFLLDEKRLAAMRALVARLPKVAQAVPANVARPPAQHR